MIMNFAMVTATVTNAFMISSLTVMVIVTIVNDDSFVFDGNCDEDSNEYSGFFVIDEDGIINSDSFNHYGLPMITLTVKRFCEPEVHRIY